MPPPLEPPENPPLEELGEEVKVVRIEFKLSLRSLMNKLVVKFELLQDEDVYQFGCYLIISAKAFAQRSPAPRTMA
jgi:hypothetical protein